MVACTYHEENAIFPSKPVEQPGKWTHGALEQAVQDADRQVYDAYLRSDGRLACLALKESSDCSVKEVHHEHPLRNHFRTRSHPRPRIWLQDWSHINTSRKRRLVRVEISMNYERCHRRAVPPFTSRVLCLIAVRIIHNEATVQTTVVLERKSVEKRNNWFSKGSWCCLNRTSIRLALILNKDAGHLAGCPNELNLFTLNESGISTGIPKQGSHFADREMCEDCVIGNLFYSCLPQNFTS
jgi:hypothetical protein